MLTDKISKLERLRNEKLEILAHILADLGALDEEFRGQDYTEEADYRRLNLSLDEASHRTALNATLVRLRNLRAQSKRKMAKQTDAVA